MADVSSTKRTPFDPDRQRVVGCELLRHFMRESHYRHFAITAMKAAIVIFCLGYVRLTWLQIWFCAGIAAVGLRYSVEREYGRPIAFDSFEAQKAFVKAMKPVYALHGAIWGMATLFYFNRLPTSNQYACGLIMACVAALPLRSAAMVPVLFRIYLNTLFSVTIACVAVATTTSLLSGVGGVGGSGIAPVADSGWISRYLFAAVPIFQWWLFASVGNRVHANQRGHYELQ